MGRHRYGRTHGFYGDGYAPIVHAATALGGNTHWAYNVMMEHYRHSQTLFED